MNIAKVNNTAQKMGWGQRTWDKIVKSVKLPDKAT